MKRSLLYCAAAFAILPMTARANEQAIRDVLRTRIPQAQIISIQKLPLDADEFSC